MNIAMSDGTDSTGPEIMTTEPNQWTNLHDLVEQYEMAIRTYRADSFSQKIRDFIGSKSWNITNAVALGLGSFSWNDVTTRPRGSCQWALFQLVVFNDMVASLPNGAAIKVYAGNNIFNSLDKKFLEHIGVNMIEMKNQGRRGTPRVVDLGPTATLVGPHTLLFMHGLTRTNTIDDVCPELFIGDISDRNLEGLQWTDEVFRAFDINPELLSKEMQDIVDHDCKIVLALQRFRNERSMTTLLTEDDSFAPYFGINADYAHRLCAYYL
jgi:hypothetical protein